MDSILIPKTWTMRDGTEIAIEDMTDQHLWNTIKMLERNAESIKAGYEGQLYTMEGFFQGEMADYELGCLQIDVERMTPEEFLEEQTEYRELVNEYEKRGLQRVQPSVSLIDKWIKRREQDE